MVNFDHSPYFSLCMGSVTIPDLFVFGSIQFLAIIFRKSSFSHIYLVSYLYYNFSSKCILFLRLILSCIYIPTYTYIHTYIIHYFTYLLLLILPMTCMKSIIIFMSLIFPFVCFSPIYMHVIFIFCTYNVISVV